MAADTHVPAALAPTMIWSRSTLRPSEAYVADQVSELVRTAARILRCPTAGLSRPPRTGRVCTHQSVAITSFADAIIIGGRREIVTDASQDERFRHLLQVALFPKARFLAGFPIVGRDSTILGAITFADYAPRPSPSAEEIAEVNQLAGSIAFLLSDDVAGRA